jgi:hypothetical protein
VELESISNRISRLKELLQHNYNSCACTRTQKKIDQEETEQFYANLSTAYMTLPQYDPVILMGNINSKIGKETSNQDVAVKFTLQDVASGNGQKVIQFAQMNEMFVVSAKMNIERYIKAHG